MEGDGQGEGATVQKIDIVAVSLISCSLHDVATNLGESSDNTVSTMRNTPSVDHSPVVSSATEVLTDKIIRQVEYYFSDENLATDKYLMTRIRKDEEGFVPLGLIASFRKMKKLSEDISVITDALRKSSLLVVSEDGEKVKRLHPFPVPEVSDPKLCTVRVENLPDGHTIKGLQNLFGQVGSIRNISIPNPHTADALSFKPHALVEYETIESAEKAVASFNDRDDWRNGLRVKLVKQMAKPEPRRKSHKGQVTDQEADDVRNLNGDVADDKDRDAHKIQNKGRSRKQKYRGASEVPKPPPGPRMPDGTRGFAMGRGRPLVST